MKKLVLKISASAVVILILLFIWRCKYTKNESAYFTPKIVAVHSSGKKYVGSETCVECHQDIANTHFKTAHYNTSAIADAKSIKGKFGRGTNTVLINDATLEMVSERGSFYQKSFPRTRYTKPSTTKLDIVIGSGVKGQTFLNWQNDTLYQLQVSYYVPTQSWINSPNYPLSSFKRSISDDCLKCHMTYAHNKKPDGKGNEYFKDKMIFGVDCERCHGPSEAHVVYHRANPDVTTAQFVTKIDSLSRQRKLDLCAQCHSGLRNRQLKGNPFSFLVGEDLEAYSKNYYSGKPKEELDVHGNQYGLLTSSACYIKSPAMDCTTCHDPHKNQRGDTPHFNNICMQCHTDQKSGLCTKEATGNNQADANCIKCHMPLVPSKSMRVQINSDSLEKPVYIRTHLIKTYSQNASIYR